MLLQLSWKIAFCAGIFGHCPNLWKFAIVSEKKACFASRNKALYVVSYFDIIFFGQVLIPDMKDRISYDANELLGSHYQKVTIIPNIPNRTLVGHPISCFHGATPVVLRNLPNLGFSIIVATSPATPPTR